MSPRQTLSSGLAIALVNPSSRGDTSDSDIHRTGMTIRCIVEPPTPHCAVRCARALRRIFSRTAIAQV
jgi:hypothetical protein